MIRKHQYQKGQVLVLVALGLIGLIAFVGLAVDGGNAFSERRRAQNAADTAALAGALNMSRLVRTIPNPPLTAPNSVFTSGINAAFALTTQNKFVSGDGYHTVTVSIPPAAGCNGEDSRFKAIMNNDTSVFHKNYYIQVVIDSYVDTYFARIIGMQQTHNCVEAVARFKNGNVGPLFLGNAVVGLDPNGTSYLSQSNAQYWKIYGGGVFANNDAVDKHAQVSFPGGGCVTSVGTSTGFTTCVQQNMASMKINYPDDILQLEPGYPDNFPPKCDGTAYRGGDGLLYPDAGKDLWNGSLVDHFEDQYAPGLYCITDAGGNVNGTITGNGVTFYIMDQDFTNKYVGGGSISATAPTDGPYKGFLVFSDVTPTPCTQNFSLRGNGSSPIVGTILLPSACIDYLGNSDGTMNYVQLIGYTVYSNGTADLNITYNASDQGEANVPSDIELVH